MTHTGTGASQGDTPMRELVALADMLRGLIWDATAMAMSDVDNPNRRFLVASLRTAGVTLGLVIDLLNEGKHWER